MNIEFYLTYHTQWGQQIFLCITHPGNEESTKELFPFTYLEKDLWSTILPATFFSTEVQYHYLIRQEGEPDLLETGQPHQLPPLPAHSDSVILFDHWQPSFADEPFFASYFRHSIFQHMPSVQEIGGTTDLGADQVLLRCLAPMIYSDKELLLCGENPLLGNWDPLKARPFSSQHFPVWELILPKEAIRTGDEYKFIVRDGQKNIFNWEEGQNRQFNIPPQLLTKETPLIIQGLHLNNPLTPWRGAGVVIPVFSLRSEQSFGIGEFTDLIPLIDWASQTGQKFIQILPINDTTLSKTWKDSYPYNANSIFALHPAYLNLEEAGILANQEERERFRTLGKQLNKLSEVDYEQVTQAKWEYLRQLYQQEGEKLTQSANFQQFIRDNQEWLLPYAAFSYLRDFYKTPDFHWWDTHSIYHIEEIKALTHPDHPASTEIQFYYFIQYHLDRQMRRVHAYAQSKGIALKGDIPIGISRNSVEAWTNPELFHLNSQAGAPPDAFAQEGQNWGFPTYNWEQMAKDQYTWWKKRFRKMADYFDAYRIDHILGFFRIWEIPIKAVQGTLGYFNPALPYSEEEIASFGFQFRPTEMSAPFIRDYFLYDLFGKETETVKELYLERVTDGIYRLRKEFDTQREIYNYFKESVDEAPRRISKGLMQLAGEVLFIADPQKQGLFHPRICAQQTRAYQALSLPQKQAFDKLYNHYFFVRHNSFWAQQALQKLPALLKATDMLPCGEDLGMIPACVNEVMDELKILRLEIQRMPKKEGVLFDNPEEYPYFSVCTTSTHDMSPLRMWWMENQALSQQYYNQMLHFPGWQPATCTGTICEAILRSHLQSPAMLAIFPLQDWLSMDEKVRRPNASEERINIPAIPRHYWRYRMHLTLEALLQEKELNHKIGQLIQESGR